MFLRALLVIASGFIFIFSPGLPMNLISRYSPDYKRSLVYWGIAGWVVSTIFALFMNNLIKQIIYSGNDLIGFTGQPIDFFYIIASSLISGISLGITMRFILKYRVKILGILIRVFSPLLNKVKDNLDKDSTSELLPDGLALGFGAGLIAQVFTGITLVGAGFQVLFGNTESNITVDAIANSNFGLLIASLLTLILFRVALLVASAVQGVLTAKSMQGNKGQFWIGVLVTALFTSLILMIQLLMGEAIPGQVSVGLTPLPISIVSGLYYLVAFIAGYFWLVRDSQIKQK